MTGFDRLRFGGGASVTGRGIVSGKLSVVCGVSVGARGVRSGRASVAGRGIGSGMLPVVWGDCAAARGVRSGTPDGSGASIVGTGIDGS